jgi:hypothetical protein
LLWSANNLEKPIACIPGFASDKDNKLARIYYGEFPPEADAPIEAAHGFKELQYEADKYGQTKIDTLVYEKGI